MWQEFKKFLAQGNVIDLAVAVIMGTAFGAVVTSLVEDVIMPPIGLLLGGVDFSNLFINLSGTPYASLAEAQAAGAPTINYGMFLNTVINFLIVAAAVFLMIRGLKATQRGKEAVTKDCPYCYSTIPIQATRCPECTSQLAGG